MLLLSGGLIVAATAVSFSLPSAFRPYFGNLDPILATAVAVAVAAGSLAYLTSRGGFAFSAPAKRVEGRRVAATVATLFAVVTIAVDLAGGFPEDINVRLPEALLFYPVMAFVVEAVFHLAPLALLLLTLVSGLGKEARGRVMAGCVAAVVVLEPAFQVWASGLDALWVNGFLAVHLLAFNAVQLWLFRRYDFLTMYAFRLVYYLHWHIVWGYLRLHVLF
jgi:hypothetical protein